MENSARTVFAVVGLVLILLVISACGPQTEFIPRTILNIVHDPVVDPAPNGRATTFCSNLDFSNVQWPTRLSQADRTALGISLGISGSYEGADGWANLTNNFDGQGMSMGLLNQNLGQGSLQPLLIKMRTKNLAKMKSFFTPAHFDSLSSMLDTWSASTTLVPSEFDLLSPLDQYGEEPSNSMSLKALSRNTVAIQWAQNNLYNGSRFKPDWNTELTNMAQSPEYVSIQVEAALQIHDASLWYKAQIGVAELRTYILMFDLTVQNGGLYQSDINDYNTYLKTHPNMSSTEKLEKILELRQRHVKPQYVADVQSRKQTIIDGRGTVHMTQRNLEKEYCFNRLSSY